MTIPVPPNLSTDAADAWRDAYRAGYAAAAGDRKAVYAAGYRTGHAVGAAEVRDAVKRALGDRDPHTSQAPRPVWGGESPTAPHDLLPARWLNEQPGDREPTGLDGRGA